MEESAFMNPSQNSRNVLARQRLRRFVFVATVAGTLSAVLAACALPQPKPGDSRDEVTAVWGPPTAVYLMPGNIERMEYASGPYGRTTWMVDISPDRRVIDSFQALSEARFFDLQSTPNLTRTGLLQLLGRPGERRGGGRQGGEVWSWRYPTNDCLWFQASVADDGTVTGPSYGTDPRCDAPGDARQ